MMPTPHEASQKARSAVVVKLLSVVHEPMIKQLLEGLTSKVLDHQLEHPISKIIDYCLLCQADYDVVAFGTGDAQRLFTAQYAHYLVYSYIINRAAAIAVLDAEDYTVRDGIISCTDKAFIYFAHALLNHDVVQAEGVHGERKRVLRFERKAERAFRVFTEMPLKFKVQGREGKALKPIEFAIFSFTPAQGGQGWDTSWEYISQSYAVCFHGDEKYEF